MKSTKLMPMRKRLELLQEGLTEVAGELRCQAGVPVFLVARCGHPECGSAPGPDLPEDALIVELGCTHEVPQIEPPPDAAAGRLRAERQTHTDAIGRGLPEARQKALLKTIRLL